MNIYASILLIGSFITTPAAQVPPHRGQIAGLVVTSNGSIASGFTVTILGTSHSSTYKVDTTTNSDGRFKVENLLFGSYVIIPYLNSVDSRYPPGTGSFFDKHLVRVTLSKEHQSDDVVVRLDPPARILTGDVTDANSGKPLITHVYMWITGEPDRWIRFSTSAAGQYRCWIPAGHEISARFSSPGHEALTLGIPEDKTNPNPTYAVKLVPLSVHK